MFLMSAAALANSANQRVFSAVVVALTAMADCPPKIENIFCSAFSVSKDLTGTCPRM